MTQHGSFDIYDVGVPPIIAVYCGPQFRAEASELYRRHAPSLVAIYANMNALIRRFASGEQLATDSFRQEGEGWAFRASRLRFYGVYSRVHASCFVLSHPKFKMQQRLDPADEQRMLACRDLFDSLIVLPQRNPRRELH